MKLRYELEIILNKSVDKRTWLEQLIAEAHENGTGAIPALDELATLRAQNAELVAALRYIDASLPLVTSESDSQMFTMEISARAITRLRKALQEAK